MSDLAARIRSGWRPTRAQKMAGCCTIEELDAFVATGKRFEPLSEDEVRLAQEMRAKMMRQG